MMIKHSSYSTGRWKLTLLFATNLSINMNPGMSEVTPVFHSGKVSLKVRWFKINGPA